MRVEVDEYGEFRIIPDTNGMLAPYACLRCGCVHDAGTVTVIARYSDCSVWKCPQCKATLDDRPGGWGGTRRIERSQNV